MAPPPSPATWQELDAAAREVVLQRLASDAEVRELLAKEHPEDAAIYLRDAEPFRAAIAALQAAANDIDQSNRKGRTT